MEETARHRNGGGGGRGPRPSLPQDRKELRGQVATTPHQEIQGHRFLPTPLNSGPSHPKLLNPIFVLHEEILTLRGGC